MSLVSGLTLAVFAALSGALSESETERQYRINNVEWKDYIKKNKKISPEGFLNEQWRLSGFLYGTADRLQEKLFFKGRPITAKENSCEVMATYNALLALGRPEPFPDVLKEYSKGGICFHGIFGTDPKAVKRFFEKRGFNVTEYAGRQIELLKSEAETVSETGAEAGTETGSETGSEAGSEPGHKGTGKTAYIFTTYNKKNNPFSMIHTMCISVEESGYRTHNDYEGDKIYPSVYEAVTGYVNGKSGPFYVLRIET